MLQLLDGLAGGGDTLRLFGDGNLTATTQVPTSRGRFDRNPSNGSVSVRCAADGNCRKPLRAQVHTTPTEKLMVNRAKLWGSINGHGVRRRFC